MGKLNHAADAPESDYEVDDPEPAEEYQETAEPYDEPAPGRLAAAGEGLGALRNRLRSRLHAQAARPGEQPLVSSKVLWGLFWGIAGLLLLCFILWFTIWRTRAEQAFEDNMKLMNEGKIAQAISGWQQFLDRFPTDSRARDARIHLGEAKIRRNSIGVTPDWAAGLEDLQEFIKVNRDDERFSELREQIRGHGERIARGAAEDAGRTNQRELLQVADEAANVVASFSPENTADPEFLADFQKALRTSENQIIKQETLDAGVSEIEKSIEAKQPMEALRKRVELIRQYADFESNENVREALQKALEVERSLVARDEIRREAVQEDRLKIVPEPLSLTFHPQPLVEANFNAETLVYAVAGGCCYGIHPGTGKPLWRRVIGFDSPFFPIEVVTSVPGLLLYDTNHGELVLLDARSGELRWRQRLSENEVEMPSGAPLVEGGQVYLATRSRRLYKIDLESGRITTRMTFSQQVNSPPLLVDHGGPMILAGDAEVLYTLSLTPLECTSVSYVGHSSGTVEAPLQVMGNLLLLCENDGPDSSTLHVLSLAEGENWLAERATAKVNGHVRDDAVLRGNQLFLPSSEERVTLFQVSDNPERPPLTRIAQYDEQSTHTGPTYLVAGAGGQFWMASRALRRFQVQANVIKADPNEIAVGISTQPPRISGQFLYLGRRLPHTGAVIFEQADSEKMVSSWRTVLGARPLSWSYDGGEFAFCLTETGDLFRVAGKELEQGGFLETTIEQLRLPENLTEPLRVADLGEGRFAAYAAGETPMLWIINAQGQITRRVPLETPLECDPVVLGPGVVLPLPGRLLLTGMTSSSLAARDYMVPVGEGDDARWSQLAAVDEMHFLALNSNGVLQRIQYQTTPLATLREVTRRDLDAPVDYPVQVHNGQLLLADARGNLQMIDASNLETLAEVPLPGPVSNALWLIEDRLYVETGANQLHCFELADGFRPLWSVPVEGGLGGAPLPEGDALLVALLGGDVLALQAETGNVMNRLSVGQVPGLGPRRFGNRLILPSIDGSLYRIDPLAEAPQ